jgi:methylglutaconyl-CoA hydratase
MGGLFDRLRAGGFMNRVGANASGRRKSNNEGTPTVGRQLTFPCCCWFSGCGYFGILPAVISPCVLRAIGPRQALRYFQTAERFDAQKALSMGLVHEVCEPEALDEGGNVVVKALLQGGPKAQNAAKDLIAAVAGQPLGAALCEETAQRIATQRSTNEAREGISAFLEKRPAAWTAG